MAPASVGSGTVGLFIINYYCQKTFIPNKLHFRQKSPPRPRVRPDSERGGAPPSPSNSAAAWPPQHTLLSYHKLTKSSCVNVLSHRRRGGLHTITHEAHFGLNSRTYLTPEGQGDLTAELTVSLWWRQLSSSLVCAALSTRRRRRAAPRAGAPPRPPWASLRLGVVS